MYEIWAVKGKERIKVGQTRDERIYIVRLGKDLKRNVRDYAFFIRAAEKCGQYDSEIFKAPGAVVEIEKIEEIETKNESSAAFMRVTVVSIVILLGLIN